MTPWFAVTSSSKILILNAKILAEGFSPTIHPANSSNLVSRWPDARADFFLYFPQLDSHWRARAWIFSGCQPALITVPNESSFLNEINQRRHVLVQKEGNRDDQEKGQAISEPGEQPDLPGRASKLFLNPMRRPSAQNRLVVGFTLSFGQTWTKCIQEQHAFTGVASGLAPRNEQLQPDFFLHGQAEISSPSSEQSAQQLEKTSYLSKSAKKLFLQGSLSCRLVILKEKPCLDGHREGVWNVKAIVTIFARSKQFPSERQFCWIAMSGAEPPLEPQRQGYGLATNDLTVV
ncbi:hypothetical protein C8J56DRAFT_1049257 [Mycena floridula]|nr:hypothetical protein C8J56DRAFT_1049257 [Mycena floridula]